MKQVRHQYRDSNESAFIFGEGIGSLRVEVTFRAGKCYELQWWLSSNLVTDTIGSLLQFMGAEVDTDKIEDQFEELHDSALAILP